MVHFPVRFLYVYQRLLPQNTTLPEERFQFQTNGARMDAQAAEEQGGQKDCSSISEPSVSKPIKTTFKVPMTICIYIIYIYICCCWALKLSVMNLERPFSMLLVVGYSGVYSGVLSSPVQRWAGTPVRGLNLV